MIMRTLRKFLIKKPNNMIFYSQLLKSYEETVI